VQLNRSQKQRAQRALERAGVVADQLERKVSRSEVKSKVVKERRKEWEDINPREGKGAVKGERRGFEVLGYMDGQDENEPTAMNNAQSSKYGNGDVSIDPEGPTILAMRTTAKPTTSLEPETTLQSLDDIPDI
jgi:Alb1